MVIIGEAREFWEKSLGRGYAIKAAMELDDKRRCSDDLMDRLDPEIPDGAPFFRVEDRYRLARQRAEYRAAHVLLGIERDT
ncbi:MAG: hypothetical protein LBP92_10650 [Deltaproteobacteria bacterium]|jgi:hypothetical protein|nr:hypothetical protein [Deltaproteobacteria bacterium]